MGDPRHTLVKLYVNGKTVADITDDLLEFTFTETMETKAASLDVKVRDTDLKYRNRLFIKKGTKVTAEWQMLNWNGDGTNPPRGSGDMWVDTVEMDLKPRSMIFKATSISPDLEKGGKKHKGTEGKNANTITKENVAESPSETKTQFFGNESEDPNADPKQKRSDQENESKLQMAERKAKETGKVVVVQNGKIYLYKMADLEAQAPFTTLSDGVSNLLAGRLKTTSQGKFKKGVLKYHDPKTGKLLTKEVEVELDDATNAEPPAAVLNSRKRPNFIGDKDDPDPDPETPIGKSQPGALSDVLPFYPKLTAAASSSSTPSAKAKDQHIDPSETKTQFLGNDTIPDHGDAANTKLVAELRGKNKNETTFTLTMQGDTGYGVGKVVALDDSFGVFKGNYLLDKCVHRINRQGYQTEIEGHKCLKGHDPGTAPKAPTAKPYTPGSSVKVSALDSGSPTPLNIQLGTPPASNTGSGD